MLKMVIGSLLFAIGVFLLLPFDEVFILLPLIAVYGVIAVPVYYAISLGCLIIGSMLIGIHLFPFLLKNPIGILMLIVAFIVLIYYVWTETNYFSGLIS